VQIGDLVKISKDTLYVYEGTVGIVTNKIWNRVDPTLVLWEVQYECEEWGTRRRRFFSQDIEVVNESR
jgi:hypothetical protein